MVLRLDRAFLYWALFVLYQVKSGRLNIKISPVQRENLVYFVVQRIFFKELNCTDLETLCDHVCRTYLNSHLVTEN